MLSLVPRTLLARGRATSCEHSADFRITKQWTASPQLKWIRWVCCMMLSSRGEAQLVGVSLEDDSHHWFRQSSSALPRSAAI